MLTSYWVWPPGLARLYRPYGTSWRVGVEDRVGAQARRQDVGLGHRDLVPHGDDVEVLADHEVDRCRRGSVPFASPIYERSPPAGRGPHRPARWPVGRRGDLEVGQALAPDRAACGFSPLIGARLTDGPGRPPIGASSSPAVSWKNEIPAAPIAGPNMLLAAAHARRIVHVHGGPLGPPPREPPRQKAAGQEPEPRAAEYGFVETMRLMRDRLPALPRDQLTETSSPAGRIPFAGASLRGISVLWDCPV